MSDEEFYKQLVEQPADKTAESYDRWAATYDQELASWGYRTPGRCAEALAGLDAARDKPIIDLGCGTGLSGLALRAAGFQVIDGVDFSEGMLEKARAHGCYRDLFQADLRRPLFDQMPRPDPPYAHAVAAGVLHTNHAPATAILDIISWLPRGGLLAFSLNDVTLRDHSYEGRVNEVVDAGAAEIAFKDYGEHLPGHDIKAMVYALRKH